MSSASKQNTTPTIDRMAEWLRDNPNIFKQQPELLELINLPDERGASSLLERQVEVLRKRITDYQTQQQTIVSMARENEAISDNFMPIFSLLIGINSLAELAEQLPVTLKQTFHINYVGFKLASRIKEQQQTAYQDTLRRLANQKTVCDNRLPSHILALFFEQPVKSAALIPLLDKPNGKPFGVLALGDDDAQRYTDDLGTIHLDRLGLMAGICLSRLHNTAS